MENYSTHKTHTKTFGGTNYMNTTKLFGCLAILLLTAILAVTPVHAQALPLTIDRVEIDDIELLSDQANRLSMERGHTYEVEAAITALADMDDVEIEVFISGFELSVWRLITYINPFLSTTNNLLLPSLGYLKSTGNSNFRLGKANS